MALVILAMLSEIVLLLILTVPPIHDVRLILLTPVFAVAVRLRVLLTILFPFILAVAKGALAGANNAAEFIKVFDVPVVPPLVMVLPWIVELLTFKFKQAAPLNMAFQFPVPVAV